MKISSNSLSMSIPENRTAERLGKEVVEEEVQLGQPTDSVAACMVDRNDCLKRQLDVLTCPDDPGVYRAGRAARSAIEGRRHREFDNRDHPVERRTQADVLHERLKVWKA